MEFPTDNEVLVRLNETIRKCPQSELLVLSEYTLTEPVPLRIRNWCRENRRYLVVGGKEPVPGYNFYDTAYVISPDGKIEFSQIKCVPIQFFKDGLPAPDQKIWQSPWGKIGICICYDLSYRRVTDQLIALGAQALVVPTMDVLDWGKRQHELHARVAPVRAAEYGVPIFRVASSGISQLVGSGGHVIASAPFGGDGSIVAGTLDISGAGHIPLDSWLAPLSSALTALVLAFLILDFLRKSRRRKASLGASHPVNQSRECWPKTTTERKSARHPSEL
jgi:predicted amidohydrolase